MIGSIAANHVFSNIRENGAMPVWVLVNDDNSARKTEFEEAFATTWEDDRTASLYRPVGPAYSCVL